MGEQPTTNKHINSNGANNLQIIVINSQYRRGESHASVCGSRSHTLIPTGARSRPTAIDFDSFFTVRPQLIELWQCEGPNREKSQDNERIVD
ncbi:hypothetical protein RND71_019435 [Anisodus tanguticus]|uniref:Uncharacterized protein n=1 Tax=Anisodus tanguticus TaxID=243964 RepID=A0AAE1S0I8_9SOLA|nr:hypothetical protein RND71_019435 [Anisodus tanguticus]